MNGSPIRLGLLLGASSLVLTFDAKSQVPAAVVPAVRTNAPVVLTTQPTATRSGDDAGNPTLYESMRRRVVVVPAVKSKNPLQWINPFAPAKYGTGEGNLIRDPITREVRGVGLIGMGY